MRQLSDEGSWHGIFGPINMDWNHNTLYQNLPVTLGCSKVSPKNVSTAAVGKSRPNRQLR